MVHFFDVEIAEKYGIFEAVFINNLEFWLAKNEANDTNYHDGRYWSYNTKDAMIKLFPYVSPKKIWNAIDHLREEGIILTGNFNEKKWDRTLWYTLSDFGKCILPERNFHFTEMENADSEKGEPIPYKNTDKKTDNKRESILTDAKEKTARFVPPTVEEVQAYCDEKGFTIDAQYYVDYYETRDWRLKDGKKMSKWKNSVNTWVHNDKERKQPKKSNDLPRLPDGSINYAEIARQGGAVFD